jgi:hypothetical protein
MLSPELVCRKRRSRNQRHINCSAHVSRLRNMRASRVARLV